MTKPPFQGFAGALRHASSRINMAAKWAAAGFLCLMVLFVTIQIVARYVLSDAPAWTEEAARYAMTWSALLAATCAFHDRVDPVLVTVSASSPRRMQTLSRLARFVCVAIFAGPMLYYSIGMVARSSLRDTESLGVNLACITVIVPIFASILLFHAVAQLFAETPEEGGR